MQRLTGLDAGFLSMETPTAPMHVAGLAIFDPSTVGERFDTTHLREVYEPRLHMAPPFRRRLREVPFGLHHPLWIEDPDFDIDWHLRHIAVLAPRIPNIGALATKPPSGAAADDVLDAAAVALTARAVLEDKARRLGERRHDAKGLVMEIVVPQPGAFS